MTNVRYIFAFHHWLTNTEHFPCLHAPRCLLYKTRQPLGAQRLERCGWCITRTSGVGLCQQAARSPLLRNALARLVSWRTRRPERTRTRTRARIALFVKRDSMKASVSSQFHHTAVGAAAATIEQCKNWKLVPVLILFIFVAQADAAARCAPACGRGLAMTALGSTLRPTPLLGCRCSLHAVFCFSLFYGLPRCRTSPIPSSISEALPAGCSLPRPRTHSGS